MRDVNFRFRLLFYAAPFYRRTHLLDQVGGQTATAAPQKFPDPILFFMSIEYENCF